MPGEVVVAIATGARVLRLNRLEGQAQYIQEGQDIRILGAHDGAEALSVKRAASLSGN